MIVDRPVLERSVTVCGPCPPDEVWDRYVRPRRWPQWSPQIRSVTYPGETISAHTAGIVHGPAGLRIRFRIVDVEAAGGGTRTGLTVRGFGPAVLLYLPAATVALRRLVRRIHLAGPGRS